MRLTTRLLFLALAFATGLAAAPLEKPEWNRVKVEPMKTSIYVGSVTLSTSDFKRDGDAFTATYAAKVFPWIFWNETGRISIHVTDADLMKLRRGERMEFTGEAFNHKEKPRRVTGYADPKADGSTGKIKVRIAVDDVELIFNGTYQLSIFFAQPEAAEASRTDS